MISSWKAYAPDFSDFCIRMTFAKPLPVLVFNVATTFFAMISDYFVSLWTVIFLRMGLYFFNSSRSGWFFLFLVVMYLDVPGIPLFLCSVHSRMTCILASFVFFAMILYCLYEFLECKDTTFLLYKKRVVAEKSWFNVSHRLFTNKYAVFLWPKKATPSSSTCGELWKISKKFVVFPLFLYLRTKKHAVSGFSSLEVGAIPNYFFNKTK